MSEIDEFSDLAIDEDSRVYDMYDIYLQSSHHSLATSAMLKIAELSLTDLSEESQKIANSIDPTEEEKRILRKNVIELAWHKLKGNI